MPVPIVILLILVAAALLAVTVAAGAWIAGSSDQDAVADGVAPAL
jgi:hypothetical protein